VNKKLYSVHQRYRKKQKEVVPAGSILHSILQKKYRKAEKYCEINTKMKVVFIWRMFVKHQKVEREAERREREAEEAMLKRALAEKWRNVFNRD
jgi:hypothetical protein